jgi:hypothetical protein
LGGAPNSMWNLVGDYIARNLVSWRHTLRHQGRIIVSESLIGRCEDIIGVAALAQQAGRKALICYGFLYSLTSATLSIYPLLLVSRSQPYRRKTIVHSYDTLMRARIPQPTSVLKKPLTYTGRRPAMTILYLWKRQTFLSGSDRYTYNL